MYRLLYNMYRKVILYMLYVVQLHLNPKPSTQYLSSPLPYTICQLHQTYLPRTIPATSSSCTSSSSLPQHLAHSFPHLLHHVFHSPKRSSSSSSSSSSIPAPPASPLPTARPPRTSVSAPDTRL